jgi:hypothetical protein
MKKLILIGDSIRLGYHPHVVASLAGDAEVIGVGVKFFSVDSNLV